MSIGDGQWHLLLCFWFWHFLEWHFEKCPFQTFSKMTIGIILTWHFWMFCFCHVFTHWKITLVKSQNCNFYHIFRALWILLSVHTTTYNFIFDTHITCIQLLNKGSTGWVLVLGAASLERIFFLMNFTTLEISLLAWEDFSLAELNHTSSSRYYFWGLRVVCSSRIGT